MNASLDGASPLAQQTLDLNHAEAARFMLLSIVPDLERPPWNNAVLRPLTAAEPRPATLALATGLPPVGKTVFWMGIIHAGGNLTPVIAYR